MFDAPKPRDLRLFEGEKIKLVLTPHPLSFYGLHAVWIYVIILSLFFFFVSDLAMDYFGADGGSLTLGFFGKSKSPLIAKTPFLGMFAAILDSIIGGTLSFSVRYGLVALWFILLFIPSVGLSVFRITWKWMAYMVIMAFLSIGLSLLLGIDEKLTYVFAMFFSILAILLVDMYRRSHHYIITNYRLMTDVRFIFNTRSDISYDKINNLVLDQGILGRLFDFGSVIPLTASGLGVGSDFAAVTVGAGGQTSSGMIAGGALTGGKSVNYPRTLSKYALMGVQNPRQVADMVSELIHLDNEAPYLKEISSDIKDLVSEIKQDKKPKTKRKKKSKKKKK